MPRSAATVERTAPLWHTLDADTVLTRLDSSRDGLDVADAASRLASVGPNELVDKGTKPAARILWEQVTAFMVVLLIGAAVLSLVIGKYQIGRAHV